MTRQIATANWRHPWILEYRRDEKQCTLVEDLILVSIRTTDPTKTIKVGFNRGMRTTSKVITLYLILFVLFVFFNAYVFEVSGRPCGLPRVPCIGQLHLHFLVRKIKSYWCKFLLI